MLYPIKRYKDFQGWIPEVDVDGTDVKDSFVSDCENIDFENAFLKNAIKPASVSFPAEVSAYLASGYDLLSVQYFAHETRGDSFFYILYKFTTEHLLKFIIKDETSTYELNIDEQNSDIIFLSKPTNIVFALAENQLKISLNVDVTYTALSKTVVANLTLTYLKERIYVESDVKRAEGWYLFPRWLGWSTPDEVTVVDDFRFGILTPDVPFVTEGFEDASYESWFKDFGTFPRTTTNPISGIGSGLSDNLAGGSDQLAAVILSNWQAISKIRFKLQKQVGSAASGTVTIKFQRNNIPPSTEYIDVHTLTYDIADLTFVVDVEVNWNLLLSREERFWISRSLRVQFTVPPNCGILIDDFEVEAFQKVGIIAKYVDGQRAQIQGDAVVAMASSNTDPYYQLATLKIPVEAIDWRISEYELYLSKGENIPHELISTLKVEDSGFWVLDSENNVEADFFLQDPKYDGSVYTYDEDEDPEVTVTTLIFNYGLTNKVKVFSVDEDTDLIGSLILSEAFHKARTYFVKGDIRVYQSHLSGTGRAQPDSFPFSVENLYGFFETFKSEKNFTVAVTPQDELVVGTKRKAYVYFIQGGQGTILRILKAINGGQSVIGSRAMLSDLEGQPEATVLAWYNEEGIYLSPGGRREPKDIVKATHKNYWLSRTDKDQAIFFFNKAKKEVWIAFPNREVIIYELDFNKWKKYKYSFAITNFIGSVDNDLYVLGDDNKMYKIDFGSGSTLTGFVTTHYNTGTLVVDRYPLDAPEHELKVLQECYVAWNKRSTGVFQYIIIADGNTYDAINMFPNNFTDLTLAPQLLVYGKIKIKLKIPAVGAWVREIGYHFSVPGRTPGQIVRSSITGIGMNTGLELGVHQ